MAEGLTRQLGRGCEFSHRRFAVQLCSGVPGAAAQRAELSATAEAQGYERKQGQRTDGGVVAWVAPGSIAEECGIIPGDRLVALDNHPLRDVIDYRFLAAAPQVRLRFRRGCDEREVVVEKGWDDDLGIEFESPLFDGIRRCRNRCIFCFVDNLPRGMRPSLYIRDDDYRLSFLFGNFVTLTNLSEADLDRIEEQRLSPLYVSVHATERRLRNRLIGADAPDILEQIDELARRKIQVHAQVVLCPGLNDGAQLERTLDDLSARQAAVRSVALVPVGLTRFHRSSGLRSYRPEEARRLVERIRPIQQTFRRRFGRTFVHLSDEFYVMSGLPVPSHRWYDGFPQLENGVGLVRRLLTGWANCRRRLPAALPRPRCVGWICGTSAYPTLQRLADDMMRVHGLCVEVHPVSNAFFGATVTVSGLLTGADVLAAMKGKRTDGWILPRAMFDSSGERTLDDLTLRQIASELSAPVWVAESPGELMKLTLFGSATCAG